MKIPIKVLDFIEHMTGYNHESINDLWLKWSGQHITKSQHDSVWLFCEWIAGLYGYSGETYINDMGIECQWNKDMVYNLYWKGLMWECFRKTHLSELGKDEVSPIADAIIMHMAKKGYDIEFPNWQSFLNKLEKEKYGKKI